MGLTTLGVLWLVDASLQSLPQSHTCLLPCVLHLCPNFPSFYEDTSHSGLRAHPHPMWPHHNVMNAKTLLPNKVMFTRFCMDMNLTWVASVHAQSLRSCSTLWDPMDCSLPGSSVRGIFQARILEWIVMPSSRGSSWPRDWTCVSYGEILFFPIQISLNNFCHSNNLNGSKYDRHWRIVLYFRKMALLATEILFKTLMKSLMFHWGEKIQI